MNADSWVHTTAVATAVGISGCRRHPPSKGGLDFTLDVLEVPEGTSFYKALKIPPSGLFPQDDVLNTFAVSTNWNSSLEVAQAYADSPWGQSQGYQVVAFEAPKPLKLIDLGDDDTLGYVRAGLESDIRWTEGQICAEVSRLEYRAGSAGVWRLAGVGVGVAIEYETRIVHPVEYK